jgi:hypothetical protein
VKILFVSDETSNPNTVRCSYLGWLEAFNNVPVSKRYQQSKELQFGILIIGLNTKPNLQL